MSETTKRQKRRGVAPPDDRQQIILRCPPDLHWQIKMEALAGNTNKNDLILSAIARELGAKYVSRTARKTPRQAA